MSQVSDLSCSLCLAQKGKATVESKKGKFQDFIAVSLMMAKPGTGGVSVKAASSHLKLDLQITIEDREYDLMGVTMHTGTSLDSGHYTALV
jgi:uncharacterized UBP type Zn finger protein